MLVANREALVALKQVVVDVGDEAGFGVFPAAVQGSVDPIHLEPLVQVVQNGLEALALALLAAHNPQRAPGLSVAVERFCEQVELLGKGGLGQGVPRGGIARHSIHRNGPSGQLAVPLGSAHIELVGLEAAHHAVQSDKCLFGQAVDAVELFECHFGPLDPHQCLGAGISCQRFAPLGAQLVFDVGYQRHAIHLLQRQLVDDVKRADAFNFRTKKLQAVRLGVGE